MIEIDPRGPLHCPRCGGLHPDRTLFRCSFCSRPLCYAETEALPGKDSRIHFLPSDGGHTFCGYAFPTKEPLQ